jgi:hypothetical protein
MLNLYPSPLGMLGVGDTLSADSIISNMENLMKTVISYGIIRSYIGTEESACPGTD